MSLSPHDKSRDQNELLGRLCNENLDADGMRQLSEILSDDVDAKRQYVRYLDLHVALRTHVQSLDDEGFTLMEAQAALDALPASAGGEVACTAPAVRRDRTASADESAARFDRWRGYAQPLAWATFAAGLIVAASFLALRPSVVASLPARMRGNSAELGPELVASSANLRGTVGARWAGETLELPEGEAFAAGQRLELVEGLAEIVFNGGARVVLQGPAIVEIRDDRGAAISVGRIATVVPPSAGGFRLRTSIADLTVSEAEFGAEVYVDGSIVTQV